MDRRTVLKGISAAGIGGLAGVSSTGTVTAASGTYDSYQDKDSVGPTRGNEAYHDITVKTFNPTPITSGSSNYWNFVVQVANGGSSYDVVYDNPYDGIDYSEYGMRWDESTTYLDPSVVPFKDGQHVSGWEHYVDTSSDYDFVNFWWDSLVDTYNLLDEHVPDPGDLVDYGIYGYNLYTNLSKWLMDDTDEHFSLRFDWDDGGDWTQQYSNNISFEVKLLEGESVDIDMGSSVWTDIGQPYFSFTYSLTAPNCSPEKGFPCPKSSSLSTTSSDSQTDYVTLTGQEIHKNPYQLGLTPKKAKDQFKAGKTYHLPSPNVEVKPIPLSENSAWDGDSFA